MSDEPRTKPINWSLIVHHLQIGAYEAAATALWEAQLARAQANDTVTAATLAAIRQISLACHECRVKITYHQQAITESEQHEIELRNHAQTLLSKISASAPLELMDSRMESGEPANPDQQTPQYPTQDVAHTVADIAPVTIWTLLWHFLHNLRRRMGLPSDTPQPEAYTFGSQAEIASDAEPKQAVDESTVESPLIITADECVRAEAPLSFASLPAHTSSELSVTATTELTDVPTNELTVELTDDISEPAIPSSTEGVLSDQPTTPSLVIYCLGTFQVYQDDQVIEEWPSTKGQLIFKYLLIHRGHPIAKELLMDLFWPESPPDAARNNLNVAIYGLRRALRQKHPEFSHVLFQNDAYLLNPELRIWVDVEEFNQHFRTGQRLDQAKELEQALHEYRAAEALYQGEFLMEDRYEGWILPRRQSLQDDYLTLLDRLSRYYLEHADYDACVVMCGKLLATDSCREDAHRRLMCCYSRQGHYHLALRQYQICVEALARELEVEPDEATQTLHRQIRQRQSV
jgi:DNA-binding SARP family transcriptional activator